MPIVRWFPVLIVSLCSLTLPAFGQEQQEDQLVDRIADGSDSVVILNNIDVVLDDVSRLLKDVGFGGFEETARDFLEIDDKTGLSAHAGTINYWGFETFGQILELEIKDREKLFLFLNDENGQIFESEGFDLDPDKIQPFRLYSFFGGQFDRGLIFGRRFLSFNEDKEELAKKLLSAPPLANKLDETSREIINRSGISFIGQAREKDVADFANPKWFLEEYNGHLTDAEQQWLKELADVAVSSRLGLVGLKYHKQDFQIRSRVHFGADKTLEGLIDFSKSERDWKPDLGFEAEQLVLSASIQMEAFRSSAAARVVPQIVLRESGRANDFEFLQGNMLRILAELSGDSWNDLSAARVGLYQNDENEQAGQLAIVGIADARKAEDVLIELRRLSRLTSPEALSVKAAEREDELLRLVDELTSDNYNIANRAETRLVLAGQAAVPALKKGTEAWNAELRQRAERILNRIQADYAAAGKAVVDPGFWTTLNPGLRFEESTGTVAGFATHTIHVTPDPSKTKGEVGEAIGVMQGLFGEDWGSIQVVQIRDHFVFMIGSDIVMLERITKNVDAGFSTLTEPFRQAELRPVHGQIQVCLNTTRMMNLAGVRNWQGQNMEFDIIEGLCWLGLDFDQRAASVDVLVPVKQVLPFIQMGIGF